MRGTRDGIFLMRDDERTIRARSPGDGDDKEAARASTVA
jgi:hypothetical protein